MRSLLISVQDVSQLEPVAGAVPKLLIAADPVGPEVTVSGDLAAISDSVVQELQETARLTLLSVVSLVAVLIGVMQFGRVTAMARDIGRRRALGATRSLIVAQVLLGSAITAVLGVSVGTLLGAASAFWSPDNSRRPDSHSEWPSFYCWPRCWVRCLLRSRRRGQIPFEFCAFLDAESSLRRNEVPEDLTSNRRLKELVRCRIWRAVYVEPLSRASANLI